MKNLGPQQLCTSDPNDYQKEKKRKENEEKGKKTPYSVFYHTLNKKTSTVHILKEYNLSKKAKHCRNCFTLLCRTSCLVSLEAENNNSAILDWHQFTASAREWPNSKKTCRVMPYMMSTWKDPLGDDAAATRENPDKGQCWIIVCLRRARVFTFLFLRYGSLQLFLQLTLLTSSSHEAMAHREPVPPSWIVENRE